MSYISGLVILSAINWLHLIATVAWIGGIFTNLIVVLPSAKESLEPPIMGRFMGSFVKRLRVLIYASIVIFLITGSIMLLLNRHYLGLMDIGNLWSQTAFVKHIFVGVLIILAIYILEVVNPKVGQVAAKGPSPELAKLQILQMRLGISSLAIGIVILLFTGINGAISALP